MLAISDEEDLKRFAVLDRLILSGWSSTDPKNIPAEVMTAAEYGLPIPIKGPDRDKDLARLRAGPTPNEVLIARRAKETLINRLRYSTEKRRRKFERNEAVRSRAAAPAETDAQEGQECRL